MATEERTEEKPERNSSRLRGPRPKRRSYGRKPEGGESNDRNDRSRRPRPYLKSIPVPEEATGQTITGKIFDITRRYNNSYGFILLDGDREKRGLRPKIYFNMKDYEETEMIARRGYRVQFTVEKDDRDRPYATKISLTEEGKEGAVAREARIAAYKAGEAEPPAPAEGDKTNEATRRPRRVRPQSNESTLSLQVTCEGHAEPKTVEAKLYLSIGKLKYTITELFEAPNDYMIYCNRTKENPEGEMLSKKILRGMKEGDMIYLAPPRKEEEESK